MYTSLGTSCHNVTPDSNCCLLMHIQFAFRLQLATMRAPVNALDPIAIKMNICMSKQQLESGVRIVAEST